MPRDPAEPEQLVFGGIRKGVGQVRRPALGEEAQTEQDEIGVAGGRALGTTAEETVA